jgi:hypothetical protein
MKKMAGAFAIISMLCGFLLLGSSKAEAMNNESAALLAGAIVLFGPPVLQAVTGGFYYPAYYPAGTRVVVTGGGHGWYERYDRAHWRGRYDEHSRNDYRRWRKNERRPFHRDRY